MAGTGDVHDRDPRHGGLRGAVREARGLRRSPSAAWEGHRGRSSAASRCGRSPSQTTASRTSTRSSSPAIGAGWSASPTSRKAFVAATARRLRARGRSDPDAAAALLVSQNPGVFDGNPDLPGRSQRVPRRTAGTCVDAGRRGGAPDPGPVAGVLGLPLRAGTARRRRTGSRWPRRPTTRRSSRTTSCHDQRRRALGRCGARRSPSSALLVLLWEGYVRLAALDPVTLPAPSRVLSAPCGTSVRRRSVTSSRRWSRPSSARRSPSPWPSCAAIALDRWAPGRAGRSSRSWWPARRSRSSRSPRCS